MRKIMILAAALLMAVACGQTKEQKTLVLYYSQTGTTQVVAEAIQQNLGADIEAIALVNPYDGDYGSTIARGQKEMQENAYPELLPIQADLSAYDVVFIGFPIWFGTYANPIETLLNTVDFSGKKIVPFCTFGSGGLNTSSDAVKAKLTDSEVLPGYGVRAARIGAAAEEVKRFLLEGGFIEGEFEAYEAFSQTRPATEEEVAIFDAAVSTYPMIQAKATDVASRPIPTETEYIFTAQDRQSTVQIYVLAEEGKAPEFTQVCR